MKRQLRTVFVSRLAPNIRALPGGGAFEAFGHRFLVHWLRLAMVNQGLNLLQDPVPGVVDSVSVDGNTTGEYTAEKAYFSGRMRKAFKDLRHALEHQPQARHIILISSQDAPPQKLERVKRRMARVLAKHGKTVDILDAQRVAEAIADELLLSDLAVDELGEFLPELQRIAEENASSHMTPDVSGKHVARPETEHLLSDAFQTSQCVVLAGVGGSGKTDAAVAFARAREGAVDLLIWLDARELAQVNELASTPLVRGGAERNILSLLKDRRCLLVLDDLEANIPVADLSAICGTESRILVTRRNKLEPSHLAMPVMDDAQARALLNADLDLVCPDDVCARILASVGGHPFTLAIINAAVRNAAATWIDIEEDCRDLSSRPRNLSALPRWCKISARDLSVSAGSLSSS